MNETTSTTATERQTDLDIWVCLPYALPMVVFLAITSLESHVPQTVYPLVYAAKAVIVTALLFYGARTWRGEIHWESRVFLPALLAGVVGCIGWVALDKIIPYPHLGTRTALDPFVAFPDPVLRTLFLVTRFYGLSLMVPVMEEVFWRSFLLRVVTDPDHWTRRAVGNYSPVAFGIVAVMFAAAHPEWVVALLYAALMAVLLGQTRSLLSCIIAHAVTNFALGIYVLTTHDWVYW